MSVSLQGACSVFTTMVMLSMTVQQSSAAVEGEHVVPLTEIERQIQTNVEQRAKNSADLERVLAYPAAAKELSRYNVSQAQVHNAVATLSDDELARLAERARANEADVQGGLIVGILALIGLIVVIIIVVSIVAEDRPPALPADRSVEGRPAVAQVSPVYC